MGTIYTHHQKTVLVDTDAGDNKRKIIAFLGGLDLCDGRYDTPHHPIFSTLQTVHKDDYHNPTFAVMPLLSFVLCTHYLTLFNQLILATKRAMA